MSRALREIIHANTLWNSRVSKLRTFAALASFCGNDTRNPRKILRHANIRPHAFIQLPAHRFCSAVADFHDQQSTGAQTLACLSNQSRINLRSARAAEKRLVRFMLAHLARQVALLPARHIRWITRNEVEPSRLRCDALQQVAA